MYQNFNIKMNKRIILSSLANIADNFENSHEILLANEINFLMTKLAEKEQDCPDATQDIELNLKNRQKAINEQGYGPADPSQPNDKFWKKKMEMWIGRTIRSEKYALRKLCCF
jgi:hypothetical protein